MNNSKNASRNIVRNRFFEKKHLFLTVKNILQITDSSTISEEFESLEVSDIATVKNANEREITFVNSGQYLKELQNSNAGFCIISPEFLSKIPNNIIPIVSHNPYFAYSQLVNHFYQEKNIDFAGFTSVHRSAEIADSAKIAPNCYIGRNVKIGNNSKIMPGAIILDGCEIGNNCFIGCNAVISFSIIGDNCEIFNGAKIGQDGFGFVNNQGINHKIMQIGSVFIKDNVTIGANSCIDRGAIDDTIIEEQVKIDNLVQIAHNVKIGKGTFIAGCAAIAGSSEIGQFVQIGGGSNIAGHLKIGNFVKIAGMSGVMRDIKDNDIVAGIPTMKIRDFHQANIKLARLLKKQ